MKNLESKFYVICKIRKNNFYNFTYRDKKLFFDCDWNYGDRGESISFDLYEDAAKYVYNYLRSLAHAVRYVYVNNNDLVFNEFADNVAIICFKNEKKKVCDKRAAFNFAHNVERERCYNLRMRIFSYTKREEVIQRNIYRYDPVPYSKNSKKTRIVRDYLRYPKTINEIRANFNYDCVFEGKSLTRGKRRNLPTVWDDIYRSNDRNWKKQRKTQYKINVKKGKYYE